MISNLPIKEGEEVYCFMLENNNGIYKPIILPFTGKYNEYGGIDDWSDSFYYLCSRILNLDLGKTLEIANNFNPIEDGKIHFAMMKKNIVDHVLNNYTVEVYNLMNNEFVTLNFETIQNNVDDYFEELSSFLDIHPPEIKNILLNFNNNDYSIKNDITPFLNNADLYRHSELFKIKDIKKNILMDESKEYYKNIFKLYLKGLFIDYYIKSSRKLWHPEYFDGSQYDNTKEIMLLSEYIINNYKN
jgi:hypothetical protein